MIESHAIPLATAVDARRGVSLIDLLGSLWRRRWLIVGIVLPLMVAAFIIVKQIAPTYTAGGALVIASRKFMIPELETVTTPTGDVGIVRSEVAVLKSRTLLQTVAKQLKLDTMPEFNSSLRSDAGNWLKALDPRPYLNRLLAHAPDHAPDQADVVATEVEQTLNRNLDVGNDGRDYVITVQYRSLDPELSAKIVNTLMADYLQQYLQYKVSATVGASSSLDQRAEELRRSVEAADAKVAAFAAKSGVLETRLGSVSAQQLNDLNTQLSNARADRAAAEARYAQAIALQRNGGSSASSGDVLASPLIQQLRAKEAELAAQEHDIAARLGPSHPDRQSIEKQLADLRHTIAVEVEKVVQSLRGQVDVARAREQQLAQKVAQVEGAARTSAEAQATLQRLQDDADGKRKVYNEFLLRVAQTAKPDDHQQADARVISNAVPPVTPSGPRVFLTVLLTGFIGTLGCVAGVLMHDEIDHGFESLGEVRTGTGLVGFAAIPFVRRRGRRRLWHRYVLDHPHSSLAETLRGFRARLQSTARYRPAKIILFTSPEIGEGKTSLALAFARLGARDGHRVLLIECDLRHPALGTILAPASVSEFGAVLAGAAPWRESVRTDAASGLHYLTVAGAVPNVARVIEDDGIGQILGDAAGEYDLVIVDAPPIMRVPDAVLLAHHVDIIALVVSWKQTQRRIVAETLRRLDMSTDKLCGIILNKVATERGSDDSYSGYNR